VSRRQKNMENQETEKIQEVPVENTESTEEKKEESSEETPEEEKPSSQIYVIKVTTNKEDRALEMISDKIQKKNLNVYTLTRPHGLRGYIFLEAPEREIAEEAAYNLPYVKGIIGKTVTYDEIKNMLTPTVEEININMGDIVEIIGEPFKKEKAKVTRIDSQKAEVVVTLLGAVVPIPVTVKMDNVRVIRREGEEDSGIGEEYKNVQSAPAEDDIGPKIGGL